MFRHANRSVWIAFALAAALRLGIGPGLIAAQVISGAHGDKTNCGNRAFQLPNTDCASALLTRQNASTFEAACTQHDDCYYTLGQTKLACDLAFLRDLRAGCRDTFQDVSAPSWIAAPARLGCRYQAETYFIAVSGLLPVHTAYCYEQHYARAGTRRDDPGVAAVLAECWRER